MAFPFLLAAYAVGTGLRAYGQAKQSKDQADALGFNARLFEEQAKRIGISNDLDLSRFTRQKDRTTSAQRTLFARGGVSSQGSPLAVMAETASEFELDAQIRDYNSKIQQYSLLSQANEDRNLARAFRRQTVLSPFTSIFQTGSKFLIR